MNTYYCVTSTFDDRGNVSAHITRELEAAEKPESTYTSTSRRDIYNDWFDSLEAAEEFVEEAKAV